MYRFQNTHVFIYAYIHLYFHTYTNIHTHTHVHKHVQIYMYVLDDTKVANYEYWVALRVVCSLKWQVSFAEYRLFYRALWQKRPIILRSLQIRATPYSFLTLTIPWVSQKLWVWVGDMGWLPLVASLKLQVSFAKKPYKRDDILQKRPIILRSLLLIATPYS